MADKIVVLGPVPPPLGGVSIHIIRYLELLRSMGWEAKAVTYTGTTRTDRFAKLREVVEKFLNIYLQVNPGAWDVLHLHYGGLGYFLALTPLLLLSPGRKVVTFHSVRVIKDLEGRPGWVRRWALFMLDRFDLFVAVREGIGEDLRALGLSRPEIVVMPAFLPPSQQEMELLNLPGDVAGKLMAGAAEGRTQVCAAAYYLGPGYGQDDLYGIGELVERLRELDGELAAPLTLWVLVSNLPDSPERQEAERSLLETAAGLENVDVELRYGIPLVPVMARCDGFLRPSREDGDSVALREALGMGLPALASDVVKRPEGAETFPLADPAGFRSALGGFLRGLGGGKAPADEPRTAGDGRKYRDFASRVFGAGPTLSRPLKSLLIHTPILLFLAALIFGAFGFIMNTPFWNPTDFQILADAHTLIQDPMAMFGHAGYYFSQPALQLVFLLEYKVFGIDPAGYIAVNLLVHTLSSFMVYMLVHLLFPRRNMAVLAAVLFAFGVGSYGRIFMAAHHLEALLVAALHLGVLYSFIRNDHRRGGALRSPFFILGVVLFLATGLTRNASISLVGSLLAYKAFFHRGRGVRAILSADILVFLGIAILYYWAQGRWGYQEEPLFHDLTTRRYFNLMSVKTIFRYLVLMFFPMQNSRLIESVPFFVTWAYEIRSIIRVLLTGAILSYSFFGFVFGSKAVRFFIAWTFITLLPFTGVTATGSWLNLNHLYLTSLGFCVILAAGANGTSGLLNRRKWRRFIPYLIPAWFVFISLVLTTRFNERNLDLGRTPEVAAMRMQLEKVVGGNTTVDSPTGR